MISVALLDVSGTASRFVATMADGVQRRTFVTGATAVALLSACSAEKKTPWVNPPEPNAFRLSSRHVKHPCKACVSHNRNRYYATAADADTDRPHDRCNCEIRGQVIPEADAARYFAGGRAIYDKRQG
jgi:hypothetical protein